MYSNPIISYQLKYPIHFTCLTSLYLTITALQLCVPRNIQHSSATQVYSTPLPLSGNYWSVNRYLNSYRNNRHITWLLKIISSHEILMMIKQCERSPLYPYPVEHILVNVDIQEQSPLYRTTTEACNKDKSMSGPQCNDIQQSLHYR